MKVASVVGTRPQFIKAAALAHAMRAREDMNHVLIHTGQHYDDNLSAVFFDELDIPAPAYHLGIGSASPGAQIGRMLESLERVFVRDKPDWAIVYGDTNSTLAGALAAAKLGLPLAHIEAGLRSFNRRMPEELNRVITDHVSDYLFAPTEAAVANLQREGLSIDKIRLVGDVMYDAALIYAEKADATSTVLQRLGLQSGGYILVTIHRAETTESPARLHTLMEGLCMASQTMPLVFPLHPRTRTALVREGLLEHAAPSIRLLEPVGFLDMIMLEKHARCIATDSGGVQKEAFFYGVPCVTLRDETEWVELVELGWNRLIPPLDGFAIAQTLLTTSSSAACPATAGEVYGGGHAAELIAADLAGAERSAGADQKVRRAEATLT